MKREISEPGRLLRIGLHTLEQHRNLARLRTIVLRGFAGMVALTMVSGCASGPLFTPVANVPQDQALVYLYRKSNFVGAATIAHIVVNGGQEARLGNGAYAVCILPPGPAEFSSSASVGLSAGSSGAPAPAPATAVPPTGNADLTAAPNGSDAHLPGGVRTGVEAGRSYYVRWSVGPKMALVEESIGAREIQGLHLAKDLQPVK